MDVGHQNNAGAVVENDHSRQSKPYLKAFKISLSGQKLSGIGINLHL